MRVHVKMGECIQRACADGERGPGVLMAMQPEAQERMLATEQRQGEEKQTGGGQ